MYRTTRVPHLLAALLAALAAAFGAGCGPRDVQSPDALVGHWEGNLAYRDATLPVDLDIGRRGESLEARLTAPGLMIRDLPVGGFAFRSPKVRFRLPVGGETWTFDGWFRRSIIVGALSGGSLPMTFNRGRLPQLGLKLVERKPDPYSADTVRFAGGEGSLAGTLYSPADSLAHPAVVLLHTSGGNTRESLRELADRFVRAGFIVLAYDKRGTGASGGADDASLADLELDAVEAVEFLRTRARVDPSRVGLCGQSQGGLLAPRVASRVRTAFAIALSPPGVPLRRMFAWQDSVDGRMGASAAPAWARSEIDADPAAPWGAISAPALVLFGERDDIVPVAASTARVREAFAHARRANARVEVVARADHALRLRLAPGEAYDFPRALPGGIDTLLAWARQQAGLPPVPPPLVPPAR